MKAEQRIDQTNEGRRGVSREDQRQIGNEPPFLMQGGMIDKGTKFGSRDPGRVGLVFLCHVRKTHENSMDEDTTLKATSRLRDKANREGQRKKEENQHT